jgi:hypothetical protein
MKIIKFSEQAKENLTCPTATVNSLRSPHGNETKAHTPFLETCSDKTVIARKNIHKGALMGHVSNGNGQIPLSDCFSIRFVASGEFVKIELNAHGSSPQYQSWQKTKAIKKEAPKAPEVKQQGQVEL